MSSSSPVQIKVTFRNSISEIVRYERIRKKIDKDIRSVAGKLSVAVKSAAPVNKRPYVIARGGKKRMAGHLKNAIGLIESNSKNYVRVYVGPRVKGVYDAWYAGIVTSGHNIYHNPFEKRNPLKRWRNKNVPETYKKTKSGENQRVEANPFIEKTFRTMDSALTRELQEKVGSTLRAEIRNQEKNK